MSLCVCLSCLNLYPCVIKYYLSLSLSLSLTLLLHQTWHLHLVSLHKNLCLCVHLSFILLHWMWQGICALYQHIILILWMCLSLALLLHQTRLGLSKRLAIHPAGFGFLECLLSGVTVTVCWTPRSTACCPCAMTRPSSTLCSPSFRTWLPVRMQPSSSCLTYKVSLSP